MADEDLGVIDGRYALLECLGSGSAGEVYRARDVRRDAVVAVKLLRDDGALPQARARFLEEARLLARVRDPFVVEVLDVGAHEGTPYLVLEYVEGETLSALLAREEAGAPGATRLLAVGLARGVAAIHAAGLTHRDLKPGNVLVDLEGRPRIADFGLARAGRGARVRTRTGVILGTPGYLPPEVLKGARPGPPGDVYALGVLYLQLFTGRAPFAGGSAGEVVQAQLRGVREDTLEGLPPGLADLLRRMTSAAPEERPTSDDLPATLERALDSTPDAAAPTRSLPRPLRAAAAPGRGSAGPRDREARPFPVVLPALALAGAAALGAALLLGPGGPSPAAPPEEPATEDRVPRAVDDLERFRYPEFLRAALGPDAARRLRTAVHDATAAREEVCGDLAEAFAEHPAGAALEVLEGSLDPGWWEELPVDPAERKAALALRRRLRKALLELERLRALLGLLGHPPEALEPLAALVAPTASVTPLRRFRVSGDRVPGARPLLEGCEILTLDPADPERIGVARLAVFTIDLPLCPDRDPEGMKREVALPLAAPVGPGEDLAVVLSVYDMFPRVVLEVTAHDARGDFLAGAFLHLPEQPARFARELAAADPDSAAPLPIQVRFPASLLQGEASGLRIRYENLQAEVDREHYEFALLPGVGQLEVALPPDGDDSSFRGGDRSGSPGSDRSHDPR